MDQTTPDQATPERTLETEAAAPPRAPQHRPASARTRRIEAALRAKAGTDHIVEWARAWVSRGTPMHRLLAARTLDFAVLTDDTMTLVSTGFFTRRPRRRVYCAELHALSVAEDPVRRGRRLRLSSDTGPELWLELGADVRGKALADALMARTGREQT